jgi:hypothetical protein
MLVNVPLTTPEEAQAFLATMRDKSKGSQTVIPKPPADLSGAGVDAWYMQQKQRELDLRKRRQEAESLLRGYRATYDGMTMPGGNHRDDELLSPSGGRYMFTSPNTRAMMRETIEDPDSDVYEQRQRAIGKLNIIEHGHHAEQQQQQFGSHVKSKHGTTTDVRDDDSCAKAPRMKETMNSAQKQAVPTPAKHMVPDETEWRDFIMPGMYCYSVELFRSIILLRMLAAVQNQNSESAPLSFYCRRKVYCGKRSVSYLCFLCMSRFS